MELNHMEENNKIPIQDEKYYLECLLNLQKQYDELLADCKDMFSVVVNLKKGRVEPTMVEFNDPNGYPSMVLDFIRDFALWKPNEETYRRNFERILKGRGEAYAKAMLANCDAEIYRKDNIHIHALVSNAYAKGYLQGKEDEKNESELKVKG